MSRPMKCKTFRGATTYVSRLCVDCGKLPSEHLDMVFLRHISDQESAQALPLDQAITGQVVVFCVPKDLKPAEVC